MVQSLPACIDIEALILGSIQLDGDLMDTLRGTIDADDFSTDRHRRIWAAMLRLYDSGVRIERVTLYHSLKESNEAESIGGLGFLASLDDGLPQIPNLERYIELLKEKSGLRRIILIADSIAKRATSGAESADELRAALSQAATEITARSPQSGLVSTREMIDSQGIDTLLRPRRTEGLRLPWAQLNDVLCGLHPGQMITVAAGTGRGKTSFALQLATHATRQGKSPVVWTLEVPPDRCFNRMVNQLAFADADRARQDALTPEERERRKDAAYWLHGHPVWFDSTSRTIPSFCANVRAAQGKSDVGLLVVDYLQLIRFAGRAESRTREVGENSRSLKLAAMALGLPVVVLSQFRRIEQGANGAMRDYTKFDLKESGDIENDSDVILIMNGPNLEGDREIPVRVSVAKQREGPTGNDVNLMFHPPSQSFYSLEERA